MSLDLITIKDPRSAAADAYRTLRTNLLFSDVDQQHLTLGITSPAEENNKEVTAANLAVTFAESGRKTILVDGDLRRPSLHRYWNAEQTRGLTSMFLEDEALQNPPLIKTSIDHLHILASGVLPANPVDVLASTRMDLVIQRLLEQADVLIFNMPPVLVAADALVLGQKLGGLLLVTQANRTRRDDTSRAKQQLERVNIKLLGAVLVDAPTDRSSKAYR